MGTSHEELKDTIFMLEKMLEYVEQNYKETYEEAEAYYMNLED